MKSKYADVSNARKELLSQLLDIRRQMWKLNKEIPQLKLDCKNNFNPKFIFNWGMLGVNWKY